MAVAPAMQLTAPSVQLFPNDYFWPLKLHELFERAAPVEVDLGAGEGSFLLSMAQKFRERNFLGIDRLAGRVRNCGRRGEQLGLTNVRVLQIEAAYAVRFLLPQNSIAVFHVAFPDPWPKRRHHRRRLITDEFLNDACRALQPCGEIRIRTDDRDYAQWIARVVSSQSRLQEIEWPDEENFPCTDFERIFRMQQLPIYRLRLRKI